MRARRDRESRQLTRSASPRDVLLSAGWRFPGARRLASRRPIVLLYHGVPRRKVPGSISAEEFDRQIAFLVRHFEVVPSDVDYDAPRRSSDRIRVVITFDDGFRNNAEVAAPILRRHGAPATFFVCSRHASSRDVLWVAYFRALQRHFPDRSFCWRGETYRMDGAHRQPSLRRLWQNLLDLLEHPEAVYLAIANELPPLEEFVDRERLEDEFAGMTAEHVRALSSDSLFRIGAHTVNHPFLSRCSPQQAALELEENKRWIEASTGRPCAELAYPSGDYTPEVLRLARERGFERGFAVTPRLGVDPRREIPRIGIYDASRAVLGFKVQWGQLMRSLRLPVG